MNVIIICGALFNSSEIYIDKSILEFIMLTYIIENATFA